MQFSIPDAPSGSHGTPRRSLPAARLGRAVRLGSLVLLLAIGALVPVHSAAASTAHASAGLSNTSAPGGAQSTARIVALNGDVAEMIWALGLGSKVVGTDLSATYPAAAAHLHNIGYQRMLTAEPILALKPTIIIGTPDAGPPTVITQLRSSGVKVVIIKSGDTTITGNLAQAVQARISEVAKALGVVAAGEKVNKTVVKQIAAAEALAKQAKSSPRVVFLLVQAQANTYLIAGKGSSFSTLITAAGGIDAGGASGVYGYIPLTPEALVKARPDILLVFKSGVDSVGGTAGLLKLPGVSLTPAGKNKRILIYEDDFLGNMGPRTGQALAQLVRGLHPELK
jgi:iron complex transport system substrate-binding protein